MTQHLNHNGCPHGNVDKRTCFECAQEADAKTLENTTEEQKCPACGGSHGDLGTMDCGTYGGF